MMVISDFSYFIMCICIVFRYWILFVKLFNKVNLLLKYSICIYNKVIKVIGYYYNYKVLICLKMDIRYIGF